MVNRVWGRGGVHLSVGQLVMRIFVLVAYRWALRLYVELVFLLGITSRRGLYVKHFSAH